MRIHQWAGPGYQVTRSEDRFFRLPLAETTLFRFTTRRFEVEPHAGAFSLKVVLRGEEHYRFGRRVLALRPNHALLVNAGETYASGIGNEAESLSIFFPHDEVVTAGRAATESPEQLLASPGDGAPAPTVAQVTFPTSPAFRSALDALIEALDSDDAAVAEQEARQLLAAGLTSSWQIAPPQALAHIRRAGTRDELVARIQRARSLIDDLIGSDLSLDRLADEACLSRYHFLRIFAEVIGETPVAYARRQRLERARRDLDRGASVERAARLAGYRNVRAFRRACRRRVRPRT